MLDMTKTYGPLYGRASLVSEADELQAEFEVHAQETASSWG